MEYAKKVQSLGTKLDEVLVNGVRAQLNSVKEKINDSVGPYSRFVRIESKRTSDLSEELAKVKNVVSSIRTKI
jgi:hypothetical protein